MKRSMVMAGLLALLAGCDAPPQQTQDSPSPETQVRDPRTPALTHWYHQRAESQLQTLNIRAGAFHKAVQGLLGEPSPQRLHTARKVWRGLYEAFNHAFVPLHLAARQTPALAKRLRRTDPVPILPGYIGAIAGWPDSGIVHDRTLELSRSTLLQQHHAGSGPASVGFPVIHFLLHGGPRRPHTAKDFRVPKKTASKRTTRANQRRRTYLRIATGILTEDLHRLATTRVHAPSAQALVRALRHLVERMIRLVGLANARSLTAPYMAPATRKQALADLRTTLRGWLAAGTPFMKLIEERTGLASSLRDRIQQLETTGDVASLQALHARLVRVGSKLAQAMHAQAWAGQPDHQ